MSKVTAVLMVTFAFTPEMSPEPTQELLAENIILWVGLVEAVLMVPRLVMLPAIVSVRAVVLFPIWNVPPLVTHPKVCEAPTENFPPESTITPPRIEAEVAFVTRCPL